MVYKTKDQEGREISAVYLPGTTKGSMGRGLTYEEALALARRIVSRVRFGDAGVNARGNRRRGRYERDTDTITIDEESQGDAELVAHETSHAIDHRLGIRDQGDMQDIIAYYSPDLSGQQANQAAREFNEIYHGAESKPPVTEAIATMIGAYIVDPRGTKEAYPLAARVCRDMINDNPDMPADEDGTPLLQLSFASAALNPIQAALKRAKRRKISKGSI